MKKLDFIKEPSGNWYIDLPEWEGGKEELQMVAGADKLLDIMSNHGTGVSIFADLQPFPNASVLELEMADSELGGGHYVLRNYNVENLDLKAWLCDVVKFVFGFLPEKIYFTKAE